MLPLTKPYQTGKASHLSDREAAARVNAPIPEPPLAQTKPLGPVSSYHLSQNSHTHASPPTLRPSRLLRSNKVVNESVNEASAHAQAASQADELSFYHLVQVALQKKAYRRPHDLSTVAAAEEKDIMQQSFSAYRSHEISGTQSGWLLKQIHETVMSVMQCWRGHSALSMLHACADKHVAQEDAWWGRAREICFRPRKVWQDSNPAEAAVFDSIVSAVHAASWQLVNKELGSQDNTNTFGIILGNLSLFMVHHTSGTSLPTPANQVRILAKMSLQGFIAEEHLKLRVEAITKQLHRLPAFNIAQLAEQSFETALRDNLVERGFLPDLYQSELDKVAAAKSEAAWMQWKSSSSPSPAKGLQIIADAADIVVKERFYHYLSYYATDITRRPLKDYGPSGFHWAVQRSGGLSALVDQDLLFLAIERALDQELRSLIKKYDTSVLTAKSKTVFIKCVMRRMGLINGEIKVAQPWQTEFISKEFRVYETFEHLQEHAKELVDKLRLENQRRNDQAQDVKPGDRISHGAVTQATHSTANTGHPSGAKVQTQSALKAPSAHPAHLGDRRVAPAASTASGPAVRTPVGSSQTPASSVSIAPGSRSASTAMHQHQPAVPSPQHETRPGAFQIQFGQHEPTTITRQLPAPGPGSSNSANARRL